MFGDRLKLNTRLSGCQRSDSRLSLSRCTRTAPRCRRTACKGFSPCGRSRREALYVQWVKLFSGIRQTNLQATSGSTAPAIRFKRAAVRILLNGEPREVAEGSTLDLVLEQAEEPAEHALVEVNGRYVPGRLLAGRVLVEGDRVEVILPAFGG
jgi:sulfur carrier protein